MRSIKLRLTANAAPLGVDDALRATVCGVRLAREIAKALEVVDDLRHGMPCEPGSLGDRRHPLRPGAREEAERPGAFPLD
jgi:hypothetical protein